MKITSIKYYLLERKNSTYPLARVTVVLDGVLKLDGMKIYDGYKGKYIAYPTKTGLYAGQERRLQPGKHLNEWFHPIEKEFSDYLERVIIEGYQKAVERGSFIYDPGVGDVGIGSNKDGKEVS